MRRGGIILILLSACASGTPSRHALRVDVVEQRGQRIVMVGPHAYTVRVSNISAEPIEVESIQLAPAGLSDFTFDDAMQTIGDVISPGETREFEMFVMIVPQGRG